MKFNYSSQKQIVALGALALVAATGATLAYQPPTHHASLPTKPAVKAAAITPTPSAQPETTPTPTPSATPTAAPSAPLPTSSASVVTAIAPTPTPAPTPVQTPSPIITSSQNQFSYHGSEGKTAFELLQSLQPTGDLDYKSYSWGVMVTKINAYTASGNQFWEFDINGAEATTGASDYVTNSGDVITWKINTF